jgi:hypothetical protein
MSAADRSGAGFQDVLRPEKPKVIASKFESRAIIRNTSHHPASSTAMKHLIISALCIPLALAGCASVSVSGTPSTPAHEKLPVQHEDHADVQGHWVGTYFQDNVHRGYPMELTADGSPNKFAVTLDWPDLGQSRTIGDGAVHSSRVVWTEEQLVHGRNIILGGRYDAALIDRDTLVGVYEKDGRRMGFFRLSRAHGEKFAAAR